MIKVAYEFGKQTNGMGLLIDGYIGEDKQASAFPVIHLIDESGRESLKITLDPSYSNIKIQCQMDDVNYGSFLGYF